MCDCTRRVSYIDNPYQLTLALPNMTCESSYQRGYSTGVTWDGSWMPGGPFLYQGKDLALRAESEGKYRAWMDGFNDGLKTRLETNAHFAAWWKRNAGKRDMNGQHMRYTPDSEVCY